ncbi:MAG: DUF2752 domain-containing protein [Bryobacterales bacterium]|nr:DUF2752 domain-containing protein [Bryobacterales bacterium]
MNRGVALRIGASAAAAGFLFAVPLPSYPLFPVCGFHWLTGHSCPLCGLTRALFAFAKGHWSQAVQLNALSPLGFGMLFSLPWQGRWRAWVWKAGVVAFGVYGVYRIAS